MSGRREEVPLMFCEHRCDIDGAGHSKAIPTRRTHLETNAIVTQEDISRIRADRNRGMHRWARKESGYAMPFSSVISKENEGETGKEERGVLRQSNKEVCSSEVCRKQESKTFDKGEGFGGRE